MNPLVSIVTVTRNSAPHVARAIESVLSQSYCPIEYVIVDGASTDETLEIANRYRARIARIVSEPDHGIYDAMNKGLGMISGTFVLFINSDDFFAHSEAVASLVSARRAHGDAPAICYSDFTKHYPSLNRSMRIKAHAQLERGFALCHQAMLVDRSVYDSVGKFDTGFRYAADHDWTARAKRAGVRFLKADISPTVVFSHGGASDKNYRASRREAGAVILREYGVLAYVRYGARQYWVHLLRTLAVPLKCLIGVQSLGSLQTFYFRAIRGYRDDDGASSQ
jgi:glycosyltransferase involved in cell wall biosynthesis